jgi:hypothetical protein
MMMIMMIMMAVTVVVEFAGVHVAQEVEVVVLQRTLILLATEVAGAGLVLLVAGVVILVLLAAGVLVMPLLTTGVVELVLLSAGVPKLALLAVPMGVTFLAIRTPLLNQSSASAELKAAMEAVTKKKTTA